MKYFTVIPQKLKLPLNFFETFPECSLPSTVSKENMLADWLKIMLL